MIQNTKEIVLGRLSLIVDVVEPDEGALGRMVFEEEEKRHTKALTALSDGITEGNKLACYKAIVDERGSFVGGELYPLDGLNLEGPVAPSEETLTRLELARGLASRFRETKGPVEKESRIKIVDAVYQVARRISPSDAEVGLTIVSTLQGLGFVQEARIERTKSHNGGIIAKVAQALQIRREQTIIKTSQNLLRDVTNLSSPEDRHRHFEHLSALTNATSH